MFEKFVIYTLNTVAVLGLVIIAAAIVGLAISAIATGTWALLFIMAVPVWGFFCMLGDT